MACTEHLKKYPTHQSSIFDDVSVCATTYRRGLVCMDVYDVLDIENKVSVAADLMMTPDSLSTCVCGKVERGIE